MLQAWQGIVPPVTVLLALMLLGLVLGRAGLLTSEFNRGLNHLLLKVTFPCLIVVSMQRPFSAEWAVMGAWAWFLSLLLYAGLFVLSGLALRWAPYEGDKKGVYRFILMFSNVGFMGFPLMEALWGRESLFLGALFNVNFNLLVFSVGIWILTRHQGGGIPWKEIVFNPGLIATVIGFALFLGSVTLPALVYKTADSLGALTTPLSMILIGSLLSRSSLRTFWKGKGLWLLAAGRLILIPVAVWALLLPWDLPHEVKRLAVLVAAMPAAANASLLAAQYTERPELAGQAVFLTTALSFVTIPVLVGLLGLAQ